MKGTTRERACVPVPPPRFPPVIISRAIYLYFRFAISYRDVEGMLALRGIRGFYETIRRWCLKFGPRIAQEIRRRQPHPCDRWHLDEMHLRNDLDSTLRYGYRLADDALHSQEFLTPTEPAGMINKGNYGVI